MQRSLTRQTWREVQGPCPACGHRRWCRVSPDGAYVSCRRQAHGAIRELKLKDGPAWLHATWRAAAPAPSLSAMPRAGAPRAADADLGRVYRALLASPELRLLHRHHEQLRHRGLTDGDISRAGYRSLPASCRATALRPLHDTFADSLLLAVPGVIRREGRYGPYLTLAGAPGLLIPVRSAAGLIVGLVVRPDDPGDGGKYRWLSSTWHGGPSPGARVHVPAGVGPARRIVLTEGVLKADVAHSLSGRPVIGLPGPHVTAEALDVLRVLRPEEALLALDADTASNPHVARAQWEGLRRLSDAGYLAGLLKWDATLGKGIDDALLATRKAGVPV